MGRLSKLALLAVAGSLGFGPTTAPPGHPAFFVFACPGGGREPRVHVVDLRGGSRPRPPMAAQIGVFSDSAGIEGPFDVIGKVRVTATSHYSGRDVLERSAKREAARLGGDAIAAVPFDLAPEMKPPASDRENLSAGYLVVRFHVR